MIRSGKLAYDVHTKEFIGPDVLSNTLPKNAHQRGEGEQGEGAGERGRVKGKVKGNGEGGPAFAGCFLCLPLALVDEPPYACWFQEPVLGSVHRLLVSVPLFCGFSAPLAGHWTCLLVIERGWGRGAAFGAVAWWIASLDRADARLLPRAGFAAVKTHLAARHP